MKGRQLKFILLLCTLAVLAYLAGEILLAISVWKCPRDPDQHKGE